MTRDKLREALAQKLRSAYLGGGSPETDRDDSSDWLDVADECIRQMEWAFRKGGLRGIQDERGTVAHGTMKKTELTLAPEDWKP